MCGQVCGQTPTFFCGSSRMQAEGEGAESNSISSKRAVGDIEGDQKGGWDRNASVGAPGCCPAIPIAGVPFAGFLSFGIFCPSPSPAHSPAPVGDLQSRSLLYGPGAFLPHTRLAWNNSSPGCGLQGWDGICPGRIHPWVSSTAQQKATYLVGITVGFFLLSEPNLRSSPGCSPWVRYSLPSSKICSDSSFPGELKREGLSPRISCRGSVSIPLVIREGPKAGGLSEKEMSGLRVCQVLPFPRIQRLALRRWCPILGKGDSVSSSMRVLRRGS